MTLHKRLSNKRIANAVEIVLKGRITRAAEWTRGEQAGSSGYGKAHRREWIVDG